MGNTTKNKVRKVFYQRIDKNDTINDYQITITRPTGQNFQPAPNVTNVGNGLYTFTYTPNSNGFWIEKIKSNSDNDEMVQVIEIQNYDLDDIQSQIANLKQGNKFLN
jgi:hypothetical protein